MKKKINIILIIAVLGLWGAVAYRFINNYFADEHANSSQRSITASNTLMVRRDTFEMHALERDPFLNTYRTSAPVRSQRRYTAQSTKAKPNNSSMRAMTEAPWPEIQYFGYIKSGNSNEVAVIKIDGKLQRLRKGEIKQGILVNSVFRDSVIVHFNKEKRTFIKN